MYSDWLSRSRSASLVMILLLSIFVPTVVFAQGACPGVNAICATPESVSQAKVCTCTVAAYLIVGKCTAIETCMGVSWGLASEGVAGATNAMSTMPPSLSSAINPSLFSQVGTFMSGNPLVTGLAIGAGMSLLSSLMSPSGGSSGSGGSGTYNSTYCMTGQYYYSANPPVGDPCAVYSPSGGAGTTLPSEGAGGTSISDLLKDAGDETIITVDTDSDTDLADLVGDGCATISSLVSCPEGYKEESQGLDADGCEQEPVCVVDTSGEGTTTGQACGSGYCSTDTYCSTVQPGQCVPNGRVDCGSYSCDAGASCGENDQCIDAGASVVGVSDLIANESLYNDGTNANTPDPSKTDLNQKNIPVPKDGVHGDLLSFGGGVTIYARSRSGGTEVSGFFGGSSSGGLCQSRPWASNFLSYVIPPSFFDGLCSIAGFGSGTVSTGFGDGQGTTRTITGPAGPAYKAPPPQTGVYPEAKIRASPESINLGGRTTVFWTSHDVSSCEEYSSDGNFTGSSTSGGASTVALSGPVTFYIRCLGVDGKYIQDSTTVNIGI